MAQEGMGRDRDMVLAPGESAFVLDTTKGHVNVIVGPNKTSMSNTDQPVNWDNDKRRFVQCSPENSVMAYPNAPEGFYLVLANPVDGQGEEHPREGTSSPAQRLKMGRRINIPGPTHFPLWPGQTAKVIEGHHLRSNQYLVVRVYNDEEARSNWGQAVIKQQQTQTSKAGVEENEPAQNNPQSQNDSGTSDTKSLVVPSDVTMGQLIVIKGTDVAFFIPPTGLEVIPEQRSNGEQYVREAVTLERLEYCILLDENGNKRYVQGPDVVFPEPTETFVTKDGQRKFKAIELNENSGIYVKVIAEYQEGEKQNRVGDELFITGKDQAIYFPREEHSIIKYGDQTIHFAIAIPAGEGRYILDRNKGEVRLVKGPKMLLPDPRSEVVVRRILAEKTVRLMYPGNERVVLVNKALEDISKALSPGEYLDTGTVRSLQSGMKSSLQYGAGQLQEDIAGESFSRKTSYTPPRSITLETKYDGAVSVSVWTGYAVLIVNKRGDRRVVVGPETILLEYDETLAPLELSTGTPKTDENLFGTVYLRVKNNKVSDEVVVETKDLVRVKIGLSYRVNFEGEEHEKWFAVENYVRLLADHLRSIIRNTAKRKGIEEFYRDAIDIVRDAVLGQQVEGKRTGRKFEENGMHVYDVEVLDVAIEDRSVAQLLTVAQAEALQATLRTSRELRDLEVTLKSEEVKQKTAEALTATVVKKNELEKAQIESALAATLAKIKAESDANQSRLQRQLEMKEAESQLTAAELADEKQRQDQRLAVKKAEIDAELVWLKGQTEEVVKRAEAVDDNLVAAMVAFSDQALMEKVSTALAPVAMMNGVSAVDILSQLFKGSPLEGTLTKLASRTHLGVAEKKAS